MKNTLASGMIAFSMLAGAQAHAIETESESSLLNIDLLEISSDGLISINQEDAVEVPVEEISEILLAGGNICSNKCNES